MAESVVQNYHRNVAELLIKKLEEGTAPWQRPWSAGGGGMPVNLATGKPYRGGNAIALMLRGFDDPRWMTYKQSQSLDAQVRKGEQATSIIYWKVEDTIVQKDADGKPVLGADGKPLTETVHYDRPNRFIAKVFNAQQIEGLTPYERPPLTWDPVEKAESLLVRSGATIEHKAQNEAFYSPLFDKIVLPLREQFPTEHGYYSTALHELGHWTGHETRLDRDLKNPFGSEAYAREELIAEIASMMLCDKIGILNEKIDQHAAYVDHWIKVLTEDPSVLFVSARTAETCVEYVMNLEQKQEIRQTEQVENIIEQTPVQSAKQAVEKRIQDSSREYLNVPFEARFVAKEAGASWDSVAKMWYIGPDGDREKLAQWVGDSRQQNGVRSDSRQPEKSADSKREYLSVPYEDRRLAKEAGARWDSVARLWYAGPEADHEQLLRWKSSAPVAAVDPRTGFSNALAALGCVVAGDHPIMDGKPHRIAEVNDLPGHASCFYVGHLDGVRPAGYIKNNRTGEEMRWKSAAPSETLKDREAVQAQCEAKRLAAAEDMLRQHERAAERLATNVKELAVVVEPTPYHTAKGIEIHKGVLLGQDGKTLCVPAQDAEGKIWTVQYINEDGTKRFAKEARKHGCFHVIGGEADTLAKASAIVISEGYATAATVAESVNYATVAAFDSGNIESVAKALREAYPDKPIVIAGDDDRHLEPRPGSTVKPNPGRTHAEAAAKAVGGIAVFPAFAPGETGRSFTDFNDLGKKSTLGAEAVRRQIAPVVERAIEQQRARELAQKNEQAQSKGRGISR